MKMTKQVSLTDKLRRAIEACLPDLKHYAATHGPGPDRRLAELLAILDEKTPGRLAYEQEERADEEDFSAKEGDLRRGRGLPDGR